MPVKTLNNITVTYNGTNLTPYLNQASLEAVAEEIDTTNLASSGDEKIPGSVNWKVPVGGSWDKALDDVLGPDIQSPPSTLRTLVVTIGESGSQVTYTWTSNAFVGNYKIDGTDTKGNIKWSGELSVSGAPTRS